MASTASTDTKISAEAPQKEVEDFIGNQEQ